MEEVKYDLLEETKKRDGEGFKWSDYVWKYNKDWKLIGVYPKLSKWIKDGGEVPSIKTRKIRRKKSIK